MMKNRPARTGILGNLLSRLFHGRRPAPPPIGPPVVPVPAPTPPAPPPDPLRDSTAGALFREINAARVAHGLKAVALDATICAFSSAWAARIAATGSLDHGNFISRVATVAPNRAAGENLGAGYATAQAEVAAWAKDPAHAAILFGAYTAVGCGVATDGRGRLWFVADFVG